MKRAERDAYYYHFNMTIAVAYGEKVITAIATTSPHFLVTPNLEPGGKGWNVTHVYTTRRAAGPIQSIKTARLVAAIMGALPVPWQKMTAKNSRDLWKKYAPTWAEPWRKMVQR